MDYFPFHFYEYNPFDGMAEVSQAALKREEKGKKEFHKIKKSLEDALRFGLVPISTLPGLTNAAEIESAASLATTSKKASKKQPDDPKYIFANALPPATHLTGYTWSTFKRFVEKNHPGWKVVRREADEKAQRELPRDQRRLGRKGKAYFVSFTYQKSARPYKERKKRSQKQSLPLEEEESPTKKAKMAPEAYFGGVVGEEDKKLAAVPKEKDKKPAAVPKKENTKPPAVTVSLSFENFVNLPEQIQQSILGYCSIDTVGSLMLSSKALNTIAKQDAVWEPHLKHMLHEFFDQSIAFQKYKRPEFGRSETILDSATPLSERHDWRQVCCHCSDLS